jgi:hypothetical protein
VTAVSGSLVAVRRTRDASSGTQLFARAAGPSLAVSDPVVIIPMRGGGLVAIKLGGSELVRLIGDTMTGPLAIQSNSVDSFLVETAAGVDIFSVNGATGAIAVDNGSNIYGYSDDGTTQKYRIRSDIGLADFVRGVTYNGVAPLAGSVQSGRYVYLTNSFPLGTLAGFTLVANRLYYVPIFVPVSITCDAFAFEVTTAVSGSVQIGLYTCTASFLPGARLILGTKTAQSTLGIKVQTHTGVVVDGGEWYFLGLCSTVAMAISGSTTKANLPSPRGGVDSSSNHYLMASEDLAGGWTNIPTTAAPGSASNLYLHVGARG